MNNWYLIYTKPRNEDTVTTKLQDCGFEVFNPKLKERKCIRRRLRYVISSLFPCYIFVKMDLRSNYRFVKYTRGIRKIVGTENSPTPVSPWIIESIRSRMEDGVVAVKPPKLNPGDEVVIKGGPLQGIEAIFEREMKGEERVIIMLKAVNVRVVADSAFISKV